MYIHSFTFFPSSCGFAIASKTILTLVVLALYLRTALCGIEKLRSQVVVLGTTFTIPSFS